MTPVRIYGEPYGHKFCAVYIFLEHFPSSSNITRWQVPSCVRAWFHDSAGDIGFYQMSLSQSESFILHETMILIIIDNNHHKTISISTQIYFGFDVIIMGIYKGFKTSNVDISLWVNWNPFTTSYILDSVATYIYISLHFLLDQVPSRKWTSPGLTGYTPVMSLGILRRSGIGRIGRSGSRSTGSPWCKSWISQTLKNTQVSSMIACLLIYLSVCLCLYKWSPWCKSQISQTYTNTQVSSMIVCLFVCLSVQGVNPGYH